MSGLVAGTLLVTSQGHEDIATLSRSVQLMSASDSGLDFGAAMVLDEIDADLWEVELKGHGKTVVVCAADQQFIATTGGRLESDWQRIPVSDLQPETKLVSIGRGFWHVSKVRNLEKRGAVRPIVTANGTVAMSVGLIVDTRTSGE